ncbi:MAG: hypothetical protein APG12_01162 [Candidatus Methanofastidiosum methylothiophilum]|uniref:Glycosyltransferase subfamily 4-like N-terminal domain-containing protein n=2 Tax=Candidatus Methanofastidiosum methylothiophilum TaxID=1705564 RepID=A0A150IK20_9EURY|nr:MAG: hypothetical protein APG10_00896 [Candidatus Methanofastidiosum methylthiophilus]KYC49913.1 MAG: hypothetical protein APG12_01162 [Candidatus Methanofastidiosum methylthiophilus]
MKCKYLFIMPDIHKEAGAEVVIRDLISLLISKEEKVSLIAYENHPDLEKLDLKFYKLRSHGKVALLRLFFLLIRIEEKIFISTCLGPIDFVILLAARLKRKKVVHYIASDMDLEKQKGLLMKLGQFSILRSDVIFYQKEEQREILKEKWGLDKNVFFIGKIII